MLRFASYLNEKLLKLDQLHFDMILKKLKLMSSSYLSQMTTRMRVVFIVLHFQFFMIALF